MRGRNYKDTSLENVADVLNGFDASCCEGSSLSFPLYKSLILASDRECLVASLIEDDAGDVLTVSSVGGRLVAIV